MRNRDTDVKAALIAILCCTLAGFIACLVKNGRSVFAVPGMAFRFISFCFAGGVFYAALRLWGGRVVVLAAFIFSLLHLVIFRVMEYRFFIHFLLYYLALGFTVYLYLKYIVVRLRGLKIGKFILIALALDVIYGAAIISSRLFSGEGSLVPMLVEMLKVQSFIGAAVGLGLEAAEIIEVRLFPAPSPR
ncbi:MAG: hypothetical protein JXB45_01500 [Candidatus Krumholzibacteriota bacterium]|nr:hypothetical protein [Candidatus Krumholzibacteriota bacterium]